MFDFLMKENQQRVQNIGLLHCKQPVTVHWTGGQKAIIEKLLPLKPIVWFCSWHPVDKDEITCFHERGHNEEHCGGNKARKNIPWDF